MPRKSKFNVTTAPGVEADFSNNPLGTYADRMYRMDIRDRLVDYDNRKLTYPPKPPPPVVERLLEVVRERPDVRRMRPGDYDPALTIASEQDKAALLDRNAMRMLGRAASGGFVQGTIDALAEFPWRRLVEESSNLVPGVRIGDELDQALMVFKRAQPLVSRPVGATDWNQCDALAPNGLKFVRVFYQPPSGTYFNYDHPCLQGQTTGEGSPHVDVATLEGALALRHTTTAASAWYIYNTGSIDRAAHWWSVMTTAPVAAAGYKVPYTSHFASKSLNANLLRAMDRPHQHIGMPSPSTNVPGRNDRLSQIAAARAAMQTKAVLQSGSGGPTMTISKTAMKDPPSPPGGKRPDHKSLSKRLAVAGVAVMDFVSEMGDVVRGIYDALPKSVRDKWDAKMEKRGPGANFGQYGTGDIDLMLRAIWENWDKVNAEEAWQNIARNSLEDMMHGVLHKQKLMKHWINANKASDKAYAELVNATLDHLGLGENVDLVQ